MGFHRSGSATAAVSTDGGLTWSSFTMPASIQCSTAYSAIYANGLFVAVDIIANKSYYSADGISWSSSSMPGGGSLWTSVFWVGDKFVAQSSFGTNSLCTSPDGVTWTVRSTINHAPFIVI